MRPVGPDDPVAHAETSTAIIAAERATRWGLTPIIPERYNPAFGGLLG
jgi:hypothetical protein